MLRAAEKRRERERDCLQLLKAVRCTSTMTSPILHVNLKNPSQLILEIDTYSYHGHSMLDPGSTFHTRDEITGVRQEHDPIERAQKLILLHELATVSELKDIEKQIRKEVDDAIAQAKESPMPDPSELFSNEYVKGYGVEVVPTSKGQALADEYGIKFFETSAKTNLNVERVFFSIARDIKQRLAEILSKLTIKYTNDQVV